MKDLRKISFLILFFLSTGSCQNKTEELKSICENHVLNNFVDDPEGFEVTNFKLTNVYKFNLNNYTNDYVSNVYKVLNLNYDFEYNEYWFKQKMEKEEYLKKIFGRLKKITSFDLPFEEFKFYVILNLYDPLGIKPNLFVSFKPPKDAIKVVRVVDENTGKPKFDPNKKFEIIDYSYEKNKPGEKYAPSPPDRKYLKKLAIGIKSQEQFKKIDILKIENAIFKKYTMFDERNKIEKKNNESKMLKFYNYRVVTRQKIYKNLKLVRYDFLFDEGNKMISVHEHE